jgi:phospholipid-binding lipoprotein MlaA
MSMIKLLTQTVLLSTLCCTNAALAGQADAPSPLAGTGIEPNVVSYTVVEEVDDPLIRLNRAIFAFNDVSYRYVLIPFARVYNEVPTPVRSSIGNFFDNIKSPIPFTNHLLQGEGRQAGVDFLRFGINSTVGLLGLFDPATKWFELERVNTGFGATLAQYKVGRGPYLVMPFAGPSSIREGSGTVLDSLLNPLGYIMEEPDGTITRVFDNMQEYAPNAPAYLELRKNSSDLYIFMRNAHLQDIQRDAEYK